MHANYLCIFASSSIVDVDGTIFIQLGIFLVMLVFLNLALFKPIVRVLEIRKEATENAREQAVRLKEQAASLVSDVDSRIRELRRVATADRDHLVDQARSRDREIMTVARAESAALLTEARVEMVQLSASVRSELMAELPVFSEHLAARVLGRRLQERP